MEQDVRERRISTASRSARFNLQALLIARLFVESIFGALAGIPTVVNLRWMRIEKCPRTPCVLTAAFLSSRYFGYSGIFG